jgi:hypothetical protein
MLGVVHLELEHNERSATYVPGQCLNVFCVRLSVPVYSYARKYYRH